MGEYSLNFALQSNDANNSYRLMELPKELAELIQDGAQQQFTIRGRSDDEAVLCTADKTYSIRAVSVSNSFCVLTPPNDDESGDGVIRASISQILELAPTIARLHRLRGLLRGCEYDEDSKDRDHDSRMPADVTSELQASDSEIEAGLRAMHILLISDELRPITLRYLNTVLELILNTLVSLSLPVSAAPIIDIVETLQSDHDILPDVTKQVVAWFGTIKADEGTWSMDTDAVVRQLGIGILSGHRRTPVDQEEFLGMWRKIAGDSFEAHVNLSLLQGNFIPSRPSMTANDMLSYFPSSELPISPADRFTELFLVQPKWKAIDIAPFLDDIAVDSKERDKLLMKYARNTTDKEGVTWYAARGGTIA